MHLTTSTLLAATGLFTTALAQGSLVPNNTRAYHLRTCVQQPGQENATQFENLYLQSYHTGAGLGDATLSSSNASDSALGYLSPLNSTTTTANNGTQQLSKQLFDLGNPFPWSLLPRPDTVFYSQWQPVRINAGDQSPGPEGSGFWINGTGLQWSYEGFGGWRVCDWWHGVPQLFFKVAHYEGSEESAPESCADVNLMPVYV